MHQPLETYIQWELKSEQVPWAQVKPEAWRRFYIVAGLDLVPEQTIIILRTGARMDRFMWAMETVPWIREKRPVYLHTIRGLLYGWLMYYSGDRQIKWEIQPIAYNGPVMLRIKDGRLDKDGEPTHGTLGFWLVDGKGNGATGFNEKPTETIKFHIKTLLESPDGTLINMLQWNSCPWGNFEQVTTPGSPAAA
ncbi:hypothetical protein PV05_03419 [Exophiala xenobiotica]|jgi:hypothetical protein|uniref:Uncharacterized protein n=1 Tax=Exophiala xenobiotica TaxID=348802 RepID=A0A0D2D9G4_9EURO|nr:uncharacterized protein PV05_03419 [Exophiala xenobiotica]KIW58927.1 hypothetical protein PV05_03419 [Exophiala xenobiotica]